ncbi:MAG: hydroxymethylbilane synthase [Methyloceanibacter sp.]
MPAGPLLIGTRGSPLALWQAEHVRARLMETAALTGEVALSVITTSGDRIKDKPLRDFGGKGLFTKEIDEALLCGEVSMAVHSMKDLETALPEGVAIAAVLPRADVRDAFISAKAPSLSELPPGAAVGTSSLRRGAQVKRMRPDLRVVDLRGNVETRLKKLADGAAHSTLLAMAGLDRLGLASRATAILSTDEMLPAVAQGAIGVTCRSDDADTLALVAPLNDVPSATAIACERAFLEKLDGSCKTPIAGLAEIGNGMLCFRGLVLTPDGSEWYGVEQTGDVAHSVQIGTAAGEELVARAGSGFLAKLI